MLSRMRLALAVLVSACAFSGLAVGAAQATVVPGTNYWAFCQNGSYVCIWDQVGFSGQGEAWQASDTNWHEGWGTLIYDDDDSAMNYAGGYNVASFNDINFAGGCQWTIGYNNYANGFAWNDDGSSHKRYSVSPC